MCLCYWHPQLMRRLLQPLTRAYKLVFQLHNSSVAFVTPKKSRAYSIATGIPSNMSKTPAPIKPAASIIVCSPIEGDENAFRVLMLQRCVLYRWSEGGVGDMRACTMMTSPSCSHRAGRLTSHCNAIGIIEAPLVV